MVSFLSKSPPDRTNVFPQESPSQASIFHLIGTLLKKVSCYCADCCTFEALYFTWQLCVFVHSYWHVQRVSGVWSGRETFVLQHQGAHRQQSVLQQSAERLRQQVSGLSSVSEPKLNKSCHNNVAVRIAALWMLLCLCRLRVCVRSRCWDACMVVDGGTSFEFNDGAIATISMAEEDQLRTVLLENWDESRAPNTRLVFKGCFWPPQVQNIFISGGEGVFLFLNVCIVFLNYFHIYWFVDEKPLMATSHSAVV